jgi:hypothetical protein
VLSPYRRSAPEQAVQEQYQIGTDGGNLAVVLHSIQSNNRPLFERIERFVQQALPDIGTLQSPLSGNATYVAFREPFNDQLIRLHEMGGGIEQLLVLATVLHTTDRSFSVAIEEPETHLHPGAQRFLLERLYDDQRQVFLATHSPTFLNASSPKSIYRVAMTDGLSKVTAVSDSSELVQTLKDLGVRNSDVLLSDGVLFVEGPSDEDALLAISFVLGLDLTQRNIGIVHIGSGERAPAAAPLASNTLEALSAKAGIPHLFLLDRDERSAADVEYLESRIPGRVRYLRGRELENYLVAPRALIAALHLKYASESELLSRVAELDEKHVANLLSRTANDLRSMVLSKRLTFALKALGRGVAPYELADELLPIIERGESPQVIQEFVERRVEREMHSFDIAAVVGRVQTEFAGHWADESERRWLVPGEELISAVYKSVGGRYAKPDDTVMLARQLRPDEVPGELAELVRQIAGLAT